MEVVKLGDLPYKRGGYDKVEEWNDTLSGG